MNNRPILYTAILSGFTITMICSTILGSKAIDANRPVQPETPGVIQLENYICTKELEATPNNEFNAYEKYDCEVMQK